MPLLSNILTDTKLTLVRGDVEQSIDSIHFDSREVKPNSLFVAVVGLKSDGHSYILTAIKSGAKVIVCETLPPNLVSGVTYLLSPNSAQTLGKIAANFYGNPSKKLKVVGVTGTNGKTTTATLLFELFRKLGYSCGLLSTVQNQINEDILATKYTTPDALQMQTLFAQMYKKGCTHCFMEVSSHALAQERTAGIEFAGAVFTNLTHDHLDFHGTFDNYLSAKKKLFDELSPNAFALVNVDDKRGRVMLQNCKAKNQKTFSLRSPADFKARLLENTLQGLLLEIHQKEVWFRLIGDFNAYNLLGVWGAALLLEENEEDVLTELSGLKAAPGRFEQVISSQGITAIVDYAHTPDALENVLKTIWDLKGTGQKIITVVGCGGDRDKTKRPLMAKIACQLSDVILLTSDNPRSEEPEQILKDMQAGVPSSDKEKVNVIILREEAIKEACRIATARDIILVAGKGHETYQEIQGERFDFDDRLLLQKYL
jgi:UDP-N-acetylmuramoyl-L-alanyl-D-glutamate--2,6-diaminopimelate ligase